MDVLRGGRDQFRWEAFLEVPFQEEVTFELLDGEEALTSHTRGFKPLPGSPTRSVNTEHISKPKSLPFFKVQVVVVW